MPVDIEYLRDHYARLSDEALLQVDRADLVEAALQCYDDELSRRELTVELSSLPPELTGGLETDIEPDWLEDAAEVYSTYVKSEAAPAPEAESARRALASAGIVCHLELVEEEAEKSDWTPSTHRWRLLVPGKLNQYASSILERDMFNADFEEQWRTHLEMLPDEEVVAMDPKLVFCGLFDRIERVTRAYRDELAQRGMKPQ